MADVFISYKREERQAIDKIASTLRSLGFSVWFDASMSAGDTFSDEIDREARAAHAILVCWSPTARDSRWVKAEAMLGFEQDKLAACYVKGPDGFSPPTPFNASHAEDLRTWLAAPNDTHAGWKSVLRRIGKLTGRADIESWGALDAQASAVELRAWLATHASSPLFLIVDELLRLREQEDEERERLEKEARARRQKEEADRRTKENANRAALQASQHAEHEASVRGARFRTRTAIGLGAGVVALSVIALLSLAPTIWSRSDPPRQPSVVPTAPPAQADSRESRAHVAGLPAPYNGANYEAGRRVFAQCRSCHVIDAQGAHRVGPNLHGVFGREVGTAEGFTYSAALQSADFTWTAEQLDHWLENPQTFLPGNRMAFAGLRDATERRDVIAYVMVEADAE
jgi:cytochrome c